MNPIDTQPDALRLANTLERCLQDLPDEVGLRLHRDFLTEVASELRRLHAELDRLRQAQGGEPVGCMVVRLGSDGKTSCRPEIFNGKEPPPHSLLYTAPPLQADACKVPQGLMARTCDLHEKAGMPWNQAEKLALSEAGIEDADVDELIGNCSDSAMVTLLSDEEVREFTRSLLVYGQQILPATKANFANCKEIDAEFCRLHAELDRLRQAQGGEAVAMPDKVATAVLDTPEPDKWVDCGEARPLPMFHMATLMQYGERCAEAALSTFTPDVKTRDFFVPTKVTDEMVSRFLSWKLPKNFYPDSFISFDREKHDAWGGYQNSWPTGTNLLHAGQAKEMLQHVLGNTSPPLQADAKVPLSKTDAEYWLNSRSQIIDAVEKAGFKLMSNKDGFWLSASPAAPTQVETQEVRQREIQKLQAWRDEIASGNAYRVVAEIEAILRAAARSTPPMGQK